MFVFFLILKSTPRVLFFSLATFHSENYSSHLSDSIIKSIQAIVISR
jgi:hypothetical protein